MIISEDNITAIIPQRSPFVMIDQLVSCNENCATTSFLIKADNVLVDDSELSEAGIIENIAQTAAAGFGYITQQNKKPIAVGYIAAVKNLEIFALPKIGETIETTITIANKIFDVTIISGSVKCNSIVQATCQMNIYIKA
ncbi:MAG: 3-hydroxyacyl-ACP dehydratase [Sphingobacteriales bacterium]